jgi:hypothetical protein
MEERGNGRFVVQAALRSPVIFASWLQARQTYGCVSGIVETLETELSH